MELVGFGVGLMLVYFMQKSMLYEFKFMIYDIKVIIVNITQTLTKL